MSDAARRGSDLLRELIRRGVLGTDPETLLDLLALCEEGEGMNETRVDDQPQPVPNAGVPVWDLVVADMKARDHVGRARYGTPLQAGNGRDALIDAYQEALDLCVYLRQAIAERDATGTVPSPPGGAT